MGRITWQTTTLATLAATVAVGGAAFAGHATIPTPESSGMLVAHNRIADVPVSSIARATRAGTDVTIAFQRMGADAVGQWHTHPGPVFVTVVAGSVTHQRAEGDRCVTTTYGAGQGFVDPGLGAVHRAIAGAEGAEFYATFLVPADGGAVTVPTTTAPEPCA